MSERGLIVAAFSMSLLGLTGCLSDHCEVYPDHCVEGAAQESGTSTMADSDGTGTSDGSDGSETSDTGTSETDTTDTDTADEDMCGNGVIDADEACDDGNQNEFDLCTTECLETVAPQLELSFSQVKQFDFSWTPVFGAEFYRLFESPEDGEPFVQVGGDIVGESIAVAMPLHFRVNASYKLQACDGQGCFESAVVEVVGSLAEAVGYFKASNTELEDYFGHSVAISGDGNTLAVGVRGEDSNATGIDGDQTDNSALNAGAVYVFARNGEVWSQQAYVKASNTDVQDYFGYSVTLSGDGNTLAVGAPQEDSNATGIDGNQADNSALSAGAIYVFARNGGLWSQQAYVKASITTGHDNFGWGVALSGDGSTLAVAADSEDSNATGIDGDQADTSGPSSGAVYVFTRTDEVWSQQAYVKASNTGVGDYFGNSMALSGDGNTLAVGAWWEDSNATGIDGNQTDNSTEDAGAAYVFARTGGVWSQQAYVKASNPGVSHRFGTSVALSVDGSILAVGAFAEDSNATGIGGNQADDSYSAAGAVYVFARTGGVWSQRAYVKASDTYFGDHFGNSVGLSGDGNTLAVGADGEGSNAVGIGGNQADWSATDAGAVYLY